MVDESLRGTANFHPKDNSPEAQEEFFQSMEDPWGHKVGEDHSDRADQYVNLLAQHSDGYIERLLDVGCSEGVLTHILSDSAATTHGLDVSKTAIERAEKEFDELEGLEFFRSNFMSARAGRKYGAVVMTGVLAYFKDDWAAMLKQVENILLKGGLLLVSYVKWPDTDDVYLPLLQDSGMFELLETREFSCKGHTHQAHILKRV